MYYTSVAGDARFDKLIHGETGRKNVYVNLRRASATLRAADAEAKTRIFHSNFTLFRAERFVAGSFELTGKEATRRGRGGQGVEQGGKCAENEWEDETRSERGERERERGEISRGVPDSHRCIVINLLNNGQERGC